MEKDYDFGSVTSLFYFYEKGLEESKAEKKAMLEEYEGRKSGKIKDELPMLSVKETKEIFGYSDAEWKEVDRKDRVRSQAFVKKQNDEFNK